MNNFDFRFEHGYLYHKGNTLCVIDLEGGPDNKGLYLWIMARPRDRYELSNFNQLKIIGIDLI